MHAYTYHPVTRELLGTFPCLPDPAELDRKRSLAFDVAIAPALAARDALIAAAESIADNVERSAAQAQARNGYAAAAEVAQAQVDANTEPDAWMIPAWSTLVAPPALAEHQAALFDGSTWTVVADWRGHVYWLADGTKVQITELEVAPPADALAAAPVVPTTADAPAAVLSVSMMQCQLALLAAGKLDAVEAAVAGAARAVQVAWRTAGTVKRDNALIEPLAQAAGLTPEQVDALFVQAASVEV
jgi:hypothetical protein